MWQYTVTFLSPIEIDREDIEEQIESFLSDSLFIADDDERGLVVRHIEEEKMDA